MPRRTIRLSNGNDTYTDFDDPGDPRDNPNEPEPILNGADIYGFGGHDTIYAGLGEDFVDGGDGNDYLRGGDGRDNLVGGHGDDWLFGDAGNDTLSGGNLDDVLWGGTGADTLYGDAGSDNLDGGAENDVLYGGEGRDALLGQGGDDTLSGGPGIDYLFGGSGNDTFVFATGSGVDLVADFTAGGTRDRLDLRNTAHNFTSLQDVLNRTTMVNGDAVIDLGGGDSVVLGGVLSSQLTSSDFIF